MTESNAGPQIEFGRVQLSSWEHDWATSSRHSLTSISDARKVLPEQVTANIYALLRRDEKRLLRGSLPFPPYDFRVRLAQNRPGDDVCARDEIRRVLNLGVLCPRWSEALRDAGLEVNGSLLTKQGQYGQLYVSGADKCFCHAYSLEWHPISVPEPIDNLLRDLSPRYQVPNPDFWDDILEARRAVTNTE